MNLEELPFKVGQSVELRSFLSGYRGAWFRCKIKELGVKKFEGKRERIGTFEYFDFPGEKPQWNRLYQKPTYKSKSRQLIIRPPFPPIYHESQLTSVNTVTDVTILVDDSWKVGDLVDWWKDGCYWSGTITEVLGNKKFQIELLPPPDGEGLAYEAFGKDLRPSLNWSLEHGWTLPHVKKSNYRHCARLLKPRAEANPLPQQNGPQKEIETPCVFSSSNGTLARDKGGQLNVTESHGISKSAEAVENIGENVGKYSHPAKFVADGSLSSDSPYPDDMETAIMELEELVHRLRWIRSFLNFRGSNSTPVQSSWKFQEHHGSSMPR